MVGAAECRGKSNPLEKEPVEPSSFSGGQHFRISNLPKLSKKVVDSGESNAGSSVTNPWFLAFGVVGIESR